MHGSYTLCMYLDLFGCISGIDEGNVDEGDVDEGDAGARVDAHAGIYVQGPPVSALPLSLALKDAASGDGQALVELFRKLEEGDIDESDVLQVMQKYRCLRLECSVLSRVTCAGTPQPRLQCQV